MGWISTPTPPGLPLTTFKNDTIRREITGPNHRILAESPWMGYGRRKFYLMEYTDEQPVKVIFMANTFYKKDEFFWTVYSEGEGPFFYDCPLELLDLTDPPRNEYSAEWREKVRDYHEQQQSARSLMNRLRQAYPNGDRRIVLRDGTEAIYARGRRKGREVAAYIEKSSPSRMILLRGQDLDLKATAELRPQKPQ